MNLPLCCVLSLRGHFGSGPLVGMGMGSMGGDIGHVGVREFRSLLQNKEVLCVLFFGGFGEIEGAGQDSAVINHDHLVVSNGMLGIDQYGNAGIL